jgi:hypothetical protein
MFKTQYFITFMDAENNELEERSFINWISREEAWDNLQADERSVEEGGPWPVGAENVRAHSREIETVRGVDYGPGHIKARFGGMRVPRGAYQFRG